MSIKVAINGSVVSAATSCVPCTNRVAPYEIQIVAINDLGDTRTNAHLTRYDTAHGKFNADVQVDGDDLVVNGDRIRVAGQRDPALLPWAEMGVDVVMECTGFFASKEKASAHLKAGARKVLISAPAGKDFCRPWSLASTTT